jgi:hypothetical protein
MSDSSHPDRFFSLAELKAMRIIRLEHDQDGLPIFPGDAIWSLATADLAISNGMLVKNRHGRCRKATMREQAYAVAA